MKKNKVTREERGWAGHFICADKCRFRRNTLLSCGNIKIVVSTVGLMWDGNKFETIGYNRYYETMVFHSDKSDTRYNDADVTKEVSFESEWAISYLDAEDKANEMHENVITEITAKLSIGHTFHTT